MRFWEKRSVDGNPKLSMVVTAYTNESSKRLDSLLSLLYCFRAQTWSNWEVLIMHDGPMFPDHVMQIERIRDLRIKTICSSTKLGQFGHPNRVKGIQLAEGDYIGMSNDDNFYMPVYFEAMLNASQSAKLAYCDMVHSHQSWRYHFVTEPRVGGIDCGCWVGAADLVKSVQWKDFGFCGDGVFFVDVFNKNNQQAKKVDNILMVHN